MVYKIMIRNYPFKNCIYPFNKEAQDFVNNKDRSFLTKLDLLNLNKEGHTVEQVFI